jgi:hypothetical protein
MATNLAIDDKLIEEARHVGKHKTKKEAVTAALRQYIRTCKRLGILELVGKVEFWPGYDHKKLRRRKRR